MEHLKGTETALIVVHFQPDIIGKGTAFGGLFRPEIERLNVIENVNNLTDVVRNAGGKVIWIRIQLKKDYSDINPRIPLLVMAQQANALDAGGEGTVLSPEARFVDGDLDQPHPRPNPFVGTDLRDKLTGISNVLVAGVATNASVETVFRHVSDHDMRAIVVSDACSAATPEVHAASLESMGLFGEVATIADVAAALA